MKGVSPMEIDYRDMGGRIRKARQQAGLSQEKLAEAADVGITHISHIENGKTIPSVLVLIKIMNRLKLTPDQLFCGYTESTGPALLRETAMNGPEGFSFSSRVTTTWPPWRRSSAKPRRRWKPTKLETAVQH
jgi:transcriptional regulator with XRE-family HTH domain